jgi:hypothetical protein
VWTSHSTSKKRLLLEMAPTLAEIKTLVASGPKSTSLPQLEAYLDAQTSGSVPYEADAVRYLVKTYQLFPGTMNESKVAYACMLALLEGYPSTDILALSYMIPIAVQKTEPCATVLECASQLEACQFVAFWKTYEKLKSSEDPVIAVFAKNSIVKLQGAILDVLALSYKDAPTQVVLSALNASSPALVTALEHSSVEYVNDSTVSFQATVDNTKRQRVYQEGVTYAAITSLMNQIA